MKKMRLSLAIVALGILSSCGGADYAADAKVFCECIKSPTADCPEKMMKIGETLKSESAAKGFMAELEKSCPEGKSMIENFMPK